MNLVKLIKFLLKYLIRSILISLIGLIFFVWMFPKNELSDYISNLIKIQTHNQLTVDFEGLNLNVLNQIGVQLDHVYIQWEGKPAISLKSLAASADYLAAIRKKPYGKINIQGLYGGNVDIQIKKYVSDSDSGKKEDEQSMIAVNAQKIDLSGIKNFLNSPLDFSGYADLNSQIISTLNLDPNQNEAPPFQLKGIQDLELKVRNFELASVMIEQAGFLTPPIKISELIMKARLYDRTFQILELQLGKGSDEVQGIIKGQVNLFPNSNTFMPQGYDLNLNLKLKQSFYDKISFVLPVLGAVDYVTGVGSSPVLKAKVSWTMGRAIPSFGPPR